MLLSSLLSIPKYATKYTCCGLQYIGFPLKQIKETIGATAAGISFIGSSTYLFEGTSKTLIEQMAWKAAGSALSTAVIGTTIGSIAAGAFTVTSPAVIATAAATGSGLFLVEKILGKTTSDLTTAFMQHGTAGVAMETATRSADYVLYSVSPKGYWDKNYITSAKNIVLSVDSLRSVISGQDTWIGQNMKAASNYFNDKFFKFIKNSYIFKALDIALDLFLVYKAHGFASDLFDSEMKVVTNKYHCMRELKAIKAGNFNLNHVDAPETGLTDSMREAFKIDQQLKAIEIHNLNIPKQVDNGPAVMEVTWFNGMTSKVSGLLNDSINCVDQIAVQDMLSSALEFAKEGIGTIVHSPEIQSECCKWVIGATLACMSNANINLLANNTDAQLLLGE